jgi:Heterokaryon incompatibility protein (HET)
MESNTANVVLLSPSQYGCLPNARSVRLVKSNPVQPSEGGIYINLVTYILDEALPFVAHSYTWGNPTTSFSEQALMSKMVYDSMGEIRPENNIFFVKYDLLDALELLKNLLSTETTLFFGIDAIRINQPSRAEYGAQVFVMNEIYGTAMSVIVWLGQEDEFIEDALSLFKSVGSITVEIHPEVTIRDWFDLFRKLGLQQASKSNHLFGVTAFFQRPFFERSCILQGVILAE